MNEDRLNRIEDKIEEAMGLILLDRHIDKGRGLIAGNFDKAWSLLDQAIQKVRDAYNE